jgi:teichoic acid transport system permease protein
MVNENNPGSGVATNIRVFEPHKASLPPLGPYLKEFWRRRIFAIELARFSDKAEYLGSRIGKVWLVLNPLLLAMVYYLLVAILRSGANKGSGLETLAHILIGLFTFYFAQNCINDGAQSIVSGGRLILNQAFPLSLLPLSSIIRAFWQFVPTIPVYFVVIFIGKLFSPDANIEFITWNLLLVPFVVAGLVITSFGLALLFATMNVYFRDTGKFLTYLMRIWLYASPVLWLPSMLHGWHRAILYVNPLGPALSATSRIWVEGKTPTLAELVGCLAWALLAISFGGYIFISRERDFAVRI